MSSKLLPPIFRLLPSPSLPYTPIRSIQALPVRPSAPALSARKRHWQRPLRVHTNQMSS